MNKAFDQKYITTYPGEGKIAYARKVAWAVICFFLAVWIPTLIVWTLVVHLICGGWLACHLFPFWVERTVSVLDRVIYFPYWVCKALESPALKPWLILYTFFCFAGCALVCIGYIIYKVYAFFLELLLPKSAVQPRVRTGRPFKPTKPGAPISLC